VGAAQIVESPQAVAFLAEDSPRFLRATQGGSAAARAGSSGARH
jgi:hypothetical protein